MSEKPSLAINKKDYTNYGRTLGLTEFLTYLMESGKFEISEHNERIKTLRDYRATVLHYNGKRIYLDFWEYVSPTYTGPVYDANFDLIIKLQHRKNITQAEMDRVARRKGIFAKLTSEQRWEFVQKVVPWTFFPSRMMKQFVGKEDELEQLPIERLGFLCGKMWKCRRQIIKHYESKGFEMIESSQEKRFSGRPLKDDQYINMMRTSKYGFVLHGRGSHLTEAKNRREIDYMILKKPLLLNYKPHYYNPLEEGKHYIYIDQNTDFENLDKLYNIDEIGQNGYEWYKQNASPEGVVNSFIQIMEDRFGKQ